MKITIFCAVCCQNSKNKLYPPNKLAADTAEGFNPFVSRKLLCKYCRIKTDGELKSIPDKLCERGYIAKNDNRG